MSYINVGSYKKMCNIQFNKSAPNENCIVHCATEETLDFFKHCRNKRFKYILVSSCSDYGIHYQHESHPNNDLRKTIGRINWKEVEECRDNYFDIKLTSCLKENCRNTDFFSIKVDSLTHHTFTEIPENIIHWYSTNVNVVHPKITMIPFGVNDEGHGFKIVESYKKPFKEKENKFYVNFTNYTTERVHLKDFMNQFSWANVRQEPGLPIEKFYEELSSYKFVLCPFGNGLDCYRIYETLIVGSIPVIQESTFGKHLTELGLPVIMINNFFGIRDKTYEDICNLFKEKDFEITEKMLNKITEEYWVETLNKAKGLL